MKTEILSINDLEALTFAAEVLADGGLIIVYFQGTYAFLCDVDSAEAANQVFSIKNRPREKGLSLVVDPRYLPDFVDMTHPAFERFPLEKASELQRQLHSVGVIYPAGPDAPPDLVQNGTILNVWTEYPPFRPFARLIELARAKGLRGFQGASTNLSHEDTYSSLSQVLEQFNGKIPLVLDSDLRLPPERRKSTTLIDLTGDQPTLIREGSVSAAELQSGLNRVGFGRLLIDGNVKVL